MQELVQLTWVKLNKFLHSEVNQLIQHIIVQDQDGQNNNRAVTITQIEQK